MSDNRMHDVPQLAIIDFNTLAAIGLKQLLQMVAPIAQIVTFNSYESFRAMEDAGQHYFHYFVSISIVLENRIFFSEQRRKTIVLTTSSDPNSQLSGFHSLCINVPEETLVKSLLMMVHQGHGRNGKIPPASLSSTNNVLTDREIEVLSLIVHGFINKEIADRLNIALTTVVTHRKNIMDKLGLRSVSALTIYAVMQGYVDISQI